MIRITPTKKCDACPLCVHISAAAVLLCCCSSCVLTLVVIQRSRTTSLVLKAKHLPNEGMRELQKRNIRENRMINTKHKHNEATRKLGHRKKTGKLESPIVIPKTRESST